VIILDANLLLYAYNASSDQHDSARRWLERTLAAPLPVGLPWATILAFLRIGTNPRAFPSPLGIEEATAIVSDWLAHPTVAVVEPGERHWEILRQLLLTVQARGPRVADAHLAALTLEHGATLCTSDRDFRLFPELRIENPLDQPSKD